MFVEPFVDLMRKILAFMDMDMSIDGFVFSHYDIYMFSILLSLVGFILYVLFWGGSD